MEWTESKLRDEVEADLDFRRKHTDLSETLIRRYAGDYYREDWASGDFGHENHEFEFAVNLIPNLVYTNPGVDIDCDVADPDDPQVRALHFGMAHWVKKQRLAHKLTRIALDTCMDFGVALLTYAAVPGYDSGSDWDEGPAIWPVLHRISPRRFFADRRAEDFDSKRRCGHIWIRDREELENAVDENGQPKFDLEALEAIAPARLDKRDRLTKIDEWLGNEPDQIVGFEVYEPETGLVYTLGYCSSGGRDGAYGFLREPRKLEFCPRGGPYVMFGCHLVPDQVYPLSPLAVTSGLVGELNAHAEQMSRDASDAKNIIFVNASNKALTEAIQNAESGSVIPIVGGWKGELERVEIGGVMPATAEHVAVLRERVDRTSGVSEQRRGVTTGATATEIDRIGQAEDARTAFARSQFHACTEQMLDIAGRMMHECPLVRFSISAEDPMTGERIIGEYRGGPPVDPMTGMPIVDPRTGQPMPTISWDAMGIRLQPYSMERVSEGSLQRKMALVTEVTPRLMVLGLQAPYMKIRPMLNDLYETMNIKGAGTRYTDWPLYEAMRKQAAMTMLMMGAMGAMGMQPGAPGAGPGPDGPKGEAAGKGQEAGMGARS